MRISCPSGPITPASTVSDRPEPRRQNRGFFFEYLAIAPGTKPPLRREPDRRDRVESGDKPCSEAVLGEVGRPR